MTNKKLEKAIEEKIQHIECSDGNRLYKVEGFNTGVAFILSNLHLLSPSDVAKIECVSELIDVLKNIKKQFQEYHHESCPWNDFDLAYEESEECNCGTQAKFIKIDSILSNFEPKKEGANE